MRNQPQGLVRLARTNPLAQGLAHSYGANILGPLAVYDAAGRANGAFGAGATGNPSGNTWRVGPGGYFINFDDTGTGAAASVVLKIGDATGSGSPGSNVFSIAAEVLIIASASANQAIYGSGLDGIEFRVTPAGKLELLKQQRASIGTSTGTIPFGVPVRVSVDYSAAGVASFYIGGAFAGSVTSAQTFTLSQQFYIGNAINTTGDNERLSNGSRVSRLDVWPRAISASEHKAWAFNPWQVYDAGSSGSAYQSSSIARAAVSAANAASIAWTEAGDTQAASGNVADQAAAAWTEGADTWAAAGTATDRAAAAWTEGGDVPVVAAVATDRGAIAWAEGNDFTQLAGTVQPNQSGGTVTGSMAWTEAGDSALMAAQLVDRGAIAFVEEGDTWSMQGASVQMISVRYSDTTIMRFGGARGTTNLGPDRLQQTTGFP